MEILTHIRGVPIQKSDASHLPYNRNLKKLLPGKRKAGILCEVLFWKQVHRGKFHDIDFDRQKIIGNYIVDFYAKNLGLIVEIDGWIHDFKKEYDENRQRYLESHGLKVFRISNHDILQNPSVVMRELEDYIIRNYGVQESNEKPAS
ncbi:DNA methylase [Flavobacteriaceae bacterium JJC]|nr:DNA methylase [Flavobacteriaceae bacterium JJC]